MVRADVWASGSPNNWKTAFLLKAGLRELILNTTKKYVTKQRAFCFVTEVVLKLLNYLKLVAVVPLKDESDKQIGPGFYYFSVAQTE